MKKIALITGASSGMGREFTRVIASKGKNLDEIWIVARRGRRLESIKETFGSKIIPIEADLTENSGFDVIEEKLTQEQPDIRILVNSAGMGVIGRFEELSIAENINMVKLNDVALTKITYMALPFMGRGAHIINMASGAAFLPQPKFAVYAASKSYVLSFSRALKEELKNEGICVTAVCPGPVKTEFFGIAEKHTHVAFYKKLVMASPSKVVARALADASASRELSVYGISMKLARVICKVLPHSLLIKLMNMFGK
ncbi:hypothetical protein SAMN05216390_102180 [Lachnospiraceae bacterium KH1T2]|nr:hypothetical protein SAMN05216390_102180 [Lachnospiraceae bacterium KH1T2]